MAPPKVKDVEARHQTQQKLEAIERYFGAWCSILARVKGRPFCPTRLFLVDTHAGAGLHLSEADPDGQVPGSPLLAVLAARTAQRAFPDVEVRVRATDHKASIVRALEAQVSPYRGQPPEGVDVTVRQRDWVTEIDALKAEIAVDDHPHGGRPDRHGLHEHRSLWFIDPYGIEGLDHGAVLRLPIGSEAVVNLDLMACLRHIGKAERGDTHSETYLTATFGSDVWRKAGSGAGARESLAHAFAESFGGKWTHRDPYLLRATGSQDRALVHFANSPRAVEAFGRSVRSALAAGTVIAGRLLTTIEKDQAARRLAGLFAALTVHLEDMHGALGVYDRGQLRAICRRAEQNGYGIWREDTGVMEWFAARRTGRADRSAPTLWDLPDAGEGLV
jgi:three-Cys-motif partner protein